MTDSSSLKFRIVARTDQDENDYSYVSDIQAGEIHLKKIFNMKHIFCRLELLKLMGDQEIGLPLETWYRPTHTQLAWSTQLPTSNLTQNPNLIISPKTDFKFEYLQRNIQIWRNENQRLISRVKYLKKELRKFTILIF